MSFNGKQYIAIGLALCAGFAIHKLASPTQHVSKETPTNDFKSLSRFDDEARELARIAPIEPRPKYLGHLQSNRQDKSKKPLEAHRSEFNFDSATRRVTKSPPPVANTNKKMKLADVMLSGPAKTVDKSANATARDLNAKTDHAHPKQPKANVARQSAASSATQPKPQVASQPKSKTAKPQTNVPPAAQVTAHDVKSEPTIIVEPVVQVPSQNRAKDSKSVGRAGQPDLAPPIAENTNRILSRNNDQPNIGQHNSKLVNSPMTSTVNNEFASFQSDAVAPLQMRLTESVALQAAHHIEYGKSLSRRGAAFAARQEFYSALRVLAQSNDAASGTIEFTSALTQAMLAMTEAKDFVRNDAEAEMFLNVDSIIETHRSRIIDQSQAKLVSPVQAMESYLAFAQEKLDRAGGRNVVSAEVFYCLGKLHTTVSESGAMPSRMEAAKAIAYHQASLLSDKKNYRSANELGVLMVHKGQLEKATELFKQSLIVQPTPQTWKNLAKTHRRLGQQNLARLAEVEFELVAQKPVAAPDAAIHWITTESFNDNPPLEFHDKERVASRPEMTWPDSDSGTGNEQSRDKTLGERLKGLF